MKLTEDQEAEREIMVSAAIEAYPEGLNLFQIGILLERSPERIRQILKNALSKLRKRLPRLKKSTVRDNGAIAMGGMMNRSIFERVHKGVKYKITEDADPDVFKGMPMPSKAEHKRRRQEQIKDDLKFAVELGNRQETELKLKENINFSIETELLDEINKLPSKKERIKRLKGLTYKSDRINSRRERLEKPYIDHADNVPVNAISEFKQKDLAKHFNKSTHQLTRDVKKKYTSDHIKILGYCQSDNKWFIRDEHRKHYAPGTIGRPKK